MKQGISLPQIPKKLLDTNKDLYDYLFGLQQALLAKQTDDYSAVDKASTDITTLSGSVTSFVADNKASQAEAVAGTLDTKIITPHTLREGLNATGDAPIYACRAWVNFNGTGTVAIRASGNVESITDNGTGDYSINFNEALEDADFAALISWNSTTSAFGLTRFTSKTASVFRFTCRDASQNAVDAKYCNVAVFR
jgi:hypothetical protein